MLANTSRPFIYAQASVAGACCNRRLVAEWRILVIQRLPEALGRFQRRRPSEERRPPPPASSIPLGRLQWSAALRRLPEPIAGFGPRPPISSSVASRDPLCCFGPPLGCLGPALLALTHCDHPNGFGDCTRALSAVTKTTVSAPQPGVCVHVECSASLTVVGSGASFLISLFFAGGERWRKLSGFDVRHVRLRTAPLGIRLVVNVCFLSGERVRLHDGLRIDVAFSVRGTAKTSTATVRTPGFFHQFFFSFQGKVFLG